MASPPSLSRRLSHGSLTEDMSAASSHWERKTRPDDAEDDVYRSVAIPALPKRAPNTIFVTYNGVTTAWGRKTLQSLGCVKFKEQAFNAYLLHPSRAPTRTLLGRIRAGSEWRRFHARYDNFKKDFGGRAKVLALFGDGTKDGMCYRGLVQLSGVGWSENMEDVTELVIEYELPLNDPYSPRW